MQTKARAYSSGTKQLKRHADKRKAAGQQNVDIGDFMDWSAIDQNRHRLKELLKKAEMLAPQAQQCL